MRYLIVLAVLACSVFAEAGLQDDWSGGPGVPGPVSGWGDEFNSSTMINWNDQAGSLFLDQMSSYYLIRQLSDLVWAKPCQLSDDGYPDVFVRYDDYSSNWYKNEGGGTSWAIRDVSDTENIVDISTADIDGDGDIDIFASSLYPSDGFVWYERLNAVGNQWQLHLIANKNSAGRVFAVDMDSDGDLDLVGMYDGENWDDEYISWWENQNNGTTWVKHAISENVGARYMTSLDVADINNDGDLDIVCGTRLSDGFYVFEQIAADSWAVHPVEYISEGDMRQVFFSDIDGDGLTDLLTCPFYYTSDVLWFRNTGNLSNWTVNIIPTNADQVFWAYPGDVDGDGESDIAVIGSSGYPINDVFWLENTDPLGGVWIQHDAFQDSSATYYYSADINTDGLTDLVASYSFYSSPAYNNAVWWNLNSGYSTGTAQLESSILYVNDVDWGSIDWSAETPAGTSVAFQVRASDDPSNMGDWSPVISSPGSITAYLSSGDSHVQYRAILSTTDPEVTPVLDNVILTWTTTGVEGSEESDELSLAVLENPVSGSVRFGVNLPSPLDVTLALYDATGRLLSNVVSGEVSAGYTEVQVDLLQPGVYFCRMQAEGNTFTEQFTVVSQ